MNEATQSAGAGARLARLRNGIADAARAAGRDPASVTLVAVAKRHPAAAVAELAEAGQRDFAENYVDEAVAKITSLAEAGLARDAIWHYIGRIQSNKTRAIAAHFDWVHSIDRAKVAERLGAQRPDGMTPLACCIEVNVSGEQSKGGVAPGEVAELAAVIRGQPRLRLRGLMALPAPHTDPTRQREAFEQVRELLETLPGPDALDVLSMGTSADYPAAIAAGATHVRIGTALFGPRP